MKGERTLHLTSDQAEKKSKYGKIIRYTKAELARWTCAYNGNDGLVIFASIFYAQCM